MNCCNDYLRAFGGKRNDTTAEESRTFPALTRRELLRVGGVSVVGAFMNSVFNPVNVWAKARTEPLGTAKNVIFLMLDGGMSQLDSFDAKEGPWTPKDFDIRSFGDVKLPHSLFKNLPDVLDKVTILRSLNAWDAVHGRAQYYVQTAHPLNLALSKEVPSIGSVVTHELADKRKDSDSLPAFLAMNVQNQAGLVNQGFLPAEFGPLGLAFNDEPPNLSPQEGMEGTFKRRWDFLNELDESLRVGKEHRGRNFVDYHEYYKSAFAIMNDARIPKIFQLDEEDKKRYGDTYIGNSLILARNVLAGNAGTRFILTGFLGWDFHSDIYAEKEVGGKPYRNHQTLCRELDLALTHLIKDLDSTPSPEEEGKTLLDDTLVVCMSEFGRTPGNVAEGRAGREHYMYAGCGLLAGGGIAGGRVLGATDEEGGKVIDLGWSAKRPMYIEDVAATIYCLTGIDWTKTVEKTPSGRAFHYVEDFSATHYLGVQPIWEAIKSQT